VEEGKLSVVHVPTDDNPADIFTKLLAKTKCQQFVELLGLRPTNVEDRRKKGDAS
jgi:hypothetical protein